MLAWPSYFFWSAGLIKDNFAFVTIGIILSVLAVAKFSVFDIFKLCFASFLAFMIRPYLFIIFIMSATIFLILGSNLRFSVKFSFLCLILIMTLLLTPFLNEYAVIAHFSGSIGDVGAYAIQQQKYMSTGSSLAVPTNNPRLVFFFLPYLLFGNLFLPLGIGASNMIGWISSFENALLVYWIFFFWKNYQYWQALRHRLPICNFFHIYFWIGMCCLSLMSTNFGLSMREKMMYVPAALICIFLTYACRRIAIIEHHLENANASVVTTSENLVKLGSSS